MGINAIVIHVGIGLQLLRNLLISGKLNVIKCVSALLHNIGFWLNTTHFTRKDTLLLLHILNT